MSALTTFRDMRQFGCHDVLVYCSNASRCWNQAKLNADQWPDDMPIKSLEPRMVCTRFGIIGADVRPDWEPHTRASAAAMLKVQSFKFGH